MKRNLFYQVIYQVLISLLPLITAPYISRVLGAEMLGIYSYTYSIANYFVIFAMLGINNYGNKEIASVSDNPKVLSQTFANILTVHIFISVISFALYIGFIIFFTSENRLIYVLQGLFVLSSVFDINWFFWGVENFKVTVIRNSAIKILTVICIFLFVNDSGDLATYTIIMAGSSLVTQVILWAFLSSYVHFCRPTFHGMLGSIKPLLVLFIPLVAVSLYKNMDKIMLGSLTTTTNVGYYENAEKIINIPVGIITAIGTVMLPRLSNMYAHSNDKAGSKIIDITFNYVMIFSFGCTFGLMSISNIFCVTFFGHEFINSGPVLFLLATTIPFLAFSNVLRTQYLIPKNRNLVYVISVIVGAVLNVIANFILIPKLAEIGAALGTVIAEVSVCMVQIFWVEREFPTFWKFVSTIRYAIVGITMFIILTFIRSILPTNFISVIIMIIIGIIYYGVIITIILYSKNDIVIRELIGKLKESLK